MGDFVNLGFAEKHWETRTARTGLAYQYSWTSPDPLLPEGVPTGDTFVVIQIEMTSPGTDVYTLWNDKPMHPQDRPESEGMTVDEFIRWCMYIGTEAAVLMGSSGFSSMYTAGFPEPRSQASGTVNLQDGGKAYHWTPSPIHVGWMWKDLSSPSTASHSLASSGYPESVGSGSSALWPSMSQTGGQALNWQQPPGQPPCQQTRQ